MKKNILLRQLNRAVSFLCSVSMMFSLVPFVFAAETEKTENAENTEVTETAETTEKQEPSEQPEKKNGLINSFGDTLNVREDAGTEHPRVGKLEDGVNVVIVGEKNDSKGTKWYKIEFGTGYGYISSDYVTIIKTEKPVDIELSDSDFELYMNMQNFPESYKPFLRELHFIYPSWIFKAFHTDIDWSYAVSQEVGKSLVSVSSKSSWKSLENGAYNWETGTWIGYDGASWVRASQGIVEYYMDPRNFLGVNSAFQFLEQSFDGSLQTIDGVKTIISNSFMENNVTDADGTELNYAQAIYSAGEKYGANPYVLAAMLIQEQGRQGTSGLISGTNATYPGIFNFFNFGAYAGNGMDAVTRGLWYASGGNNGSTSYLRPWNTRLKAIEGGASQYASGYISAGQNTLYLKKFNVQGNNLFNHQYMTNIRGAADEASGLSQGYNPDLRQSRLSFVIPVYLNMPEKPVEQPTVDGSPNNKLASLSIDGFDFLPEFETDIREYSLIVPHGTKTITLKAVPYDDKAVISGTGETELPNETNLLEVMVTAENGTKRSYNITVVVEKDPEDISVIEFSDNFEIKGTMIPGFKPGETGERVASLLLTKGSVIVSNASGYKKENTEKLVTGDIVYTYMTKGELYGAYSISVKGDIDGNGSVNVADMIKMRNHVLGTGKLEGAFFDAADITNDGVVNVADMIKVRNYVLGTGTI